MAQGLLQVKREMCEVGRRIWQKGFCAGNEGNHSVRVGEDRVLCTPTGISKGFLTPAMITLVDLEGRQIDRRNRHKRTSEILLHLEIYRKRPDVRAVIHSHPPHAVAFACSGVPLPEGIYPEAEIFLGRVPTAPYITTGYRELGESVAKLVAPETNTVLLANHGTVNFSNTLMDAYYKLEIVDAYCRILLLIKQVGRINLLSRQQMIELMAVKEIFGLPDSRLETMADGAASPENAAYLSTFPETRARPADAQRGKRRPSGERPKLA